ncbi:hypothetical protein FNF29_06189 [Cafeteria roenbergensis]|uniref:SWIM-type domain-containing protein n=1 Tax=Cafeteria roenbergensis TaxID=33653 RepID=A0A5A8CBD7_CAFRO|nr:hypothetical protein FNF29_06189 [Cafeteria roenbergensis]|eukprot:KAA0149101.1 hypothetical protein FNF29_06189 [Cafeteria roenbergensis]
MQADPAMLAGQVLTAAASDGELSDDDIRALDLLLPDGVLGRAMDLVDKGKVIRLVGRPSGHCVHIVRTLAAKRHRVERSAEQVYLCLPGLCTCPAFAAAGEASGALEPRSPAAGRHTTLCKHLVAVMLAETCGAANVKVLDDAALVLRKTALLHAVLPAAPLIPPTATAGRADGFSAASRGIDTPASLGDSGPWPAGVSQLPDR